MILTRTRLRSALERVPHADLQAFISQCIAIRTSKPTAQTPWKEYRLALEVLADNAEFVVDAVYVPTSDDALRVAAGATSQAVDSSGFEHIVRLDKLELRNFGSYRGHHTIDIGPIGQKNVTVVVGSNGDGKSTLFNAINWGLFGDEFLGELARDHQKSREDLVNHAAIAELYASRAPVDTSVVLWFTIAGTRYYVRRRFSTTILQDAPSASIASTGLFKVDAAGNHKDLPEDFLLQLLSGLPKNVKDFFLFDGERINKFASPGAQRAVKDAIRRIVGVTALEEVADHLAQLSAKLRTEQRKASSTSVADAADTEEQQRVLLEQHQAELLQLGDEVIDLRAMIGDLDKRLRESPDTGEIQKRREIYVKDLEEVRRRQEACGLELRDALASAALGFASPAVAAMVHELDVQREAGVIPGTISQQLIRDLIERERCLCGTELREGSATRLRLDEQLAAASLQSQSKQALLELFFQLRGIDTKVRSSAEAVGKRYVDYWTTLSRQEEIEGALAGIALELQGVEVVDRTGWERERNEKHDLLSTTMANRKDLERRIVDEESKLKELTKRLGELAAAEQEGHRLFVLASWAEAATANLKAMIQEFSSIARVEVERRTSELWRTLLPNVKPYKVVVTEDFELSVTSPAGTSGMSQLAMGQQQCLGLAFITAVAQVAETKPPLVIDMPFGRLADDVASEVAAALPALTSQLVLFLLPTTEWNEHIQRALSSSVARIVHLKYDEATSTTNVDARAA